MRKVIILYSILVIIWTSISLTNQKNIKITYNKNEVITASYITPKDVKELEENSPIILRGRFTGKRKLDEDPSVVGPLTISEFKVDKVHKGSIDENIISVLEPFEVIDNDFINIEGYIPMEEDAEYILFLRENNTLEGNQYTIKFMSFGKFSTLKENTVVNQKSFIKYFEDVQGSDFVNESEEICNTYLEIKSKVLNKYLQ